MYGCPHAPLLVSTFPKGNPCSDLITIDQFCCSRTSYICNCTLGTFFFFNVWLLSVHVFVEFNYMVPCIDRLFSFYCCIVFHFVILAQLVYPNYWTPLGGIWVASRLGLLWIMLLWIVCVFLWPWVLMCFGHIHWSSIAGS